MEKASMEMDLEEWEFLPDNTTTTFFDSGLQGGKELFSKDLSFDPREMIDMNYFICPVEDSSPAMERKQQGPAPITQNPIGEKKKNYHDEVAQGFKDIGVVPPVIIADRDVVSKVFFKKLKEDEFADIKMDSPKSNTRGITVEPAPIQFDEKEEIYKEHEFSKDSSFDGEEELYKEQKFSEEEEVEKEKFVAVEKKEKPCWEGIGLSIWRWRLNGIGALCSIGVSAAATICIFILGGRQRQKQQQHQNQRLQFQIYADEQRIKQVVQQATRLNQALSAVRGVPTTRAHISFGGYYDGL